MSKDIRSRAATGSSPTGVLHVVASAGRYGAEAVIAALVREQRELGLSVHVAIISDRLTATADFAEELSRDAGAEVTVIEGRGIRDLFLADRIAQLAQRAAANIIHSHGYKSDILCSRIRVGVARVSTLHGWTSVRAWSRMAAYQAIQVRSLRKFDAVVAVHESVWRQHPGLAILSRTATVANGIPERARELPTSATDFAWLPDDVPIVLVVGRLSQEKGQSLAIEAMQHLRKRGVDAVLVCAGDGPDMNALRRRVDALGLTGKVILPGYIGAVSALMKRATVLLIPSYREGLPIILLEAMRDGLPIVATAVGGVPSALDYGRVGRLVGPGSPEQIGEALFELLPNQKERVDLAANGRAHFHRLYSSRVMARKYFTLYSQVTQPSEELVHRLARIDVQ